MILDEDTPCELQYVGVPLLSQDVCRKSELGLTYQDAIGRDLPDVQLCAGHLEGGKDACQVLPNFIKNLRIWGFSPKIWFPYSSSQDLYSLLLNCS